MDTSNQEQTFGERLYDAMEEAGFSNKELASEVSVTDKTISRYLGRDKPPSLDKKKTERTMEQMAAVLGIRAGWLLRGEGPMRPQDGSGRSSEERASGPSLASRSGEGRSLHAVPEVKPVIGAGGEPKLEKVDEAFYAPEERLHRDYGTDPEKLCALRIVGDASGKTLRPGERALAARWDGEGLRDGTIYCLHGPNGFMTRRLRFGHEDGEDVIWIWGKEESARWPASAEEFEERYTPLASVLEAWKKL